MIKFYTKHGVEKPTRATKSSAGYDLAFAEDVIIPSYPRTLIKHFLMTTILKPLSYISLSEAKQSNELNSIYSTGVSIEMPDDKVALIVPRSSIGLKALLFLPNNVGVIDADYFPNEIGLNFINLGFNDVKIPKGTKVAQVIITDYYKTSDDQSTSIREGGFGSTDGK